MIPYYWVRFITRGYGWIWRNFLSSVVRWIFSDPNVSIGKGSIFYGIPIVDKAPGSQIIIKENAVFCSKSTFTALGVSHPVIIRTLSKNAVISIGKDCGMSGTTLCAVDCITVGDGVLFGADVQIFDNDFHPAKSVNRRYEVNGVNSSPVIIGNNVFVGSRATILKGVSIGDNSVIAAGSIVTHSIPKNSIAGGNPCRVMRELLCNDA